MSLGLTEILLIIIVVLILFGGKRMPELARDLGKMQIEYQKAKNTFKNEIHKLKTKTKAPEKQKRNDRKQK